MVENLSKEAKKLRQTKVILAFLAIILAIILINLIPTEKPKASEAQTTSENPTKIADSGEISEENQDYSFYYLSGLLEELEEKIESRLKSLGVPEEEYKNVSEYLSKDELFELETKITLAAELEEVWVKASPDELNSLKTALGLEENYDFSENSSKNPPSEYKNLSDLLSNYEKTLTTIEDYDIIESIHI
ncbi:hypothetical protein IKF81_02325 [Candidatus Saccharibacteria bacterium]|nr:hypothetical protein [Candidatus Saccharibacteria bacterium]